MKNDIEPFLTIDYAKNVASSLKNYIESSDRPVIDLTNVENIDLSGIQLLISSQKTGEALEKPVYFAGDIRKAVYVAFRDSGFSLVHDNEENDELFTLRRNSGEF